MGWTRRLTCKLRSSHSPFGAHQMFLEDKVGSIEVGKYADLAVWDRNLC